MKRFFMMEIKLHKQRLFLLLIMNSLFFLQIFAQDTLYVAPQEQIDWAKQYIGISGPGMPVEGEGFGGWKSGVSGVTYYGNHSRPEYIKGDIRMCSGSAVKLGLIPPIKPAWELHLRDGVVTLGGDGNYYLTGSSGDNIWAWAKGIELWKSADLHSWEYVGLVWDIDKEADEWVKVWRKHPKRAVRSVWAPEIHYIKGNYFICFSMCPHGIGILKSKTGKPEGPYVNAFTASDPIVEGIDATLFEDEDGKVYFTYGPGKEIALLKDDMSGFAEPFRQVELENPDHNPAHHSKKCVARGMNDLGHEGAVLFKRNGKYYLGAADNYEGRYSTCLGVSDNIYGPYRYRHESIPSGGGTGFFKDKEGYWWSSYFGNDSQSHFREKIGFIRVDFTSEGLAYPAKEQPFVPKDKQAEWEQKWNNVWNNNNRDNSVLK